MNTATAPMINFRYLIIGIAMLVAAGLALALTPQKKMVDQGQNPNLETMVPKQIGDWKMDENVVQAVVNPQLQKVINNTYDQTLSRTYVDSKGQRIMLSLAYGGSYGKGMQTHRPEICYPAQGFNVDKAPFPHTLHTPYGDIPTTKLVTSHGARVEPITYWAVVGDIPTEFGTHMRLAQLRYNITGVIPDGMLMRVSSIDQNEIGAFAIQEQFILDMLAALTEPHRLRVMGKLKF
jgi:EpsI family protein